MAHTNIHDPLHVYSIRELPLTQLPVDNTIDILQISWYLKLIFNRTWWHQPISPGLILCRNLGSLRQQKSDLWLHDKQARRVNWDPGIVMSRSRLIGLEMKHVIMSVRLARRTKPATEQQITHCTVLPLSLSLSTNITPLGWPFAATCILSLYNCFIKYTAFHLQVR